MVFRDFFRAGIVIRPKDWIGGMNMGQNNEWSVTIIGQGRSGEVVYREGAHELTFYWEFMTGAVLASISVGPAEEWITKEPWCRDRREEIVARVAEEAILQKAPGGTFRFDAERGFLDIFENGK